MESEIFLIAGILLVAFLYASVGHGGASGYLALMALAGVMPEQVRPSALLLNLFVSGISFYNYWRRGFFRWKLFFPFGIVSIPMAFAGAGINLEQDWYKIILGVCLMFASLRIAGFYDKSYTEFKSLPLWAGVAAGAVVGFISGMIGIGGGILLSPLILLCRWGNVKETAAVSALFIWLNSAAGLGGIAVAGAVFHPSVFLWAALAAIGGLAGGYWGSTKFSNLIVRRLLAGILLIAGFKLLWA